MERGGAMTEVTDAEVGEIDLAVVAYRDEGDWSLVRAARPFARLRGHHRQGAAPLPR